MKLLRLKITDPKGFRSLSPGFEFRFGSEWDAQGDLEKTDFEPFVCAGRNGSGKSNLLEALASIFFQMEVQRIRRNYLPEAFDDVTEFVPDGFELEYQMPVLKPPAKMVSGHVRITKLPGASPEIQWRDAQEPFFRLAEEGERDFLLPAHVVGYSSGENEILSLPFFKMRFIQFDEYWNSLKKLVPYSGRPDARMAYLDREYSQAILLCNLLFQDKEILSAYSGEVGVQELKTFRILLCREVSIPSEVIWDFAEATPGKTSNEAIVEAHPNLKKSVDPFFGETNALKIIELVGDFVERLKSCATLWTVDEQNDTLVLDYWVNDATRHAFRTNFGGAREFFQALQVLLNLNLYTVDSRQKSDLYKSTSHYANETIPVLASDQRIMRFKDFYVTKTGVSQPLLLKELSDGEHQLLHSLGLCLLFRGTNSLFLLDEPETHFNPDWRAQFISKLRKCLETIDWGALDTFASPEMLITTHTPFLISDSKPEKVLVFKKDVEGKVRIEHPDFNTLGASINKITMKTFETTDTIGGLANSMIQAFRKRFEGGEDPGTLIDEIDQQLGDSVEKILLIKAILGRPETQG